MWLVLYFALNNLQVLIGQFAVIIAFDLERKPNFVFASCVFWFGMPVCCYAEWIEP